MSPILPKELIQPDQIYQENYNRFPSLAQNAGFTEKEEAELGVIKVQILPLLTYLSQKGKLYEGETFDDLLTKFLQICRQDTQKTAEMAQVLQKLEALSNQPINWKKVSQELVMDDIEYPNHPLSKTRTLLIDQLLDDLSRQKLTQISL